MQLRGDELLKELVRLRRERTDAGRFFPDVARHFPALAAKSLRSEGTIALVQGVNLVALPVDPTEAWGSFSFLSRVPAATVVTPWDGELQQFGASALRVGSEIIGTDFPFEPGRGYVVSASGSATVTVTGDLRLRPVYVVVPSGLDLVTLVGGGPDVTSYTVFDEYFVNGSEICRFDGATQGYGCAFRDGSGFVGGEEFPLREGQGYFVRTTTSGSFPEDHQAPSLTIVSPEDSSAVYSRQPFLDVNFGDAGVGVDPGGFRCWLNGVEKTGSFTVDELGASWQLLGSEQVPEGSNALRVSVRDWVGNEREVLASFSVVITPPPPAAHFVNGYVYHGDTWEPMPGASVTIQGIPGVIFTDAEGHYVFPTPGLGEYWIDIQKEHFTYAQRHLTITEGHGDEFVDDAYLSPKDPVETRITPEEGGVAVNSDGSVFTSFPQDIVAEEIDVSAFNLDDAQDLPADLPELSVFTYCVKFWPDAVEFAGDAFVDQLNARGFAAGTPIPVGHYNPATRNWVDEGMAQVAPEPSWFDFSVRHFMSFVDCNLPVEEPPTAGPEPVEDFPIAPESPAGACPLHGSPSLGAVEQKFGGSQIYHALPAVNILGLEQAISFVYSSHAAYPQIVVETATKGITTPLLPQYTGAQLNVSGRRFTGIIEASRETTRERIRFDGQGVNGEFLPTGHYHFGAFLSNFSFAEYATAESFGAPPDEGTGVWTDFPVGFSTYSAEDIQVQNLIESSCGSGWQIEGLQRLTFRPDREVLLTEGGGSSRSYTRISARPILDLAIITEYGSDM